MPDRRTNASDAREKLEKQLQRVEDEDVDAANADGAAGRGQRGQSGPDAPGSESEKGFVAITETQRQEVNELFDLINGAGYMTTGSYQVQADGERAMVSLSVILPSSPGTPGMDAIPEDAGVVRDAEAGDG